MTLSDSGCTLSVVYYSGVKNRLRNCYGAGGFPNFWGQILVLWHCRRAKGDSQFPSESTFALYEESIAVTYENGYTSVNFVLELSEIGSWRQSAGKPLRSRNVGVRE